MIGTSSTVTIKPSRSDEIIDSDQQLKISDQIRSHFDSILPKRPLKPNRSDPDHVSPESHSDESVSTIPELMKFQNLISQSQGLVSDANTIEDEFVETGYYKQLVSIDKQHHTTGNGFIKVDGLYDIGLEIGSESGYRYGYIDRDGVSKSNPATNDWIPSSGD